MESCYAGILACGGSQSDSFDSAAVRAEPLFTCAPRGTHVKRAATVFSDYCSNPFFDSRTNGNFIFVRFLVTLIFIRKKACTLKNDYSW